MNVQHKLAPNHKPCRMIFYSVCSPRSSPCDPNFTFKVTKAKKYIRQNTIKMLNEWMKFRNRLAPLVATRCRCHRGLAVLKRFFFRHSKWGPKMNAWKGAVAFHARCANTTQPTTTQPERVSKKIVILTITKWLLTIASRLLIRTVFRSLARFLVNSTSKPLNPITFVHLPWASCHGRTLVCVCIRRPLCFLRRRARVRVVSSSVSQHRRTLVEAPCETARIVNV